MNFWRLHALVEQRLGNATFPPVPLAGVAGLVQYGCSKLANVDGVGTPILRMNNLQEYGWDLTDVKWVDLPESEVATYKLEAGDLLFNRTNSKELVGKCEVFREAGTWVFASYLIRVRLDDEQILPQFASDFLSAPMGRLQIDQMSRQIIGMTNINAEEIRSIRVPLPKLDMQATLVSRMDAARDARKAKLAEADQLMATLDDYLLATLELSAPRSDDRKVYAVPLSALGKQSRLNPDYFHPERVLAIRELETISKVIDCFMLHEVVDFIRHQIQTPGDNYLGLAHVKSHTGEMMAASDEASGACSLFRKEDVLFARLRPYLNKVYAAEQDGCCSPEFHVLRIKDGQRLTPDYLATILRSSLTLAQTRHMMTGNTHPRLTNDDVANLVIPVPQPDVQREVSLEANRRREAARRLRTEADASWQEAGRWFERQLLDEFAP